MNKCVIIKSLLDARLDKGLTQQELATAVGTSQQQIQRMEKGQAVTREMAEAISRVFQMEVDELFPILAAREYAAKRWPGTYASESGRLMDAFAHFGPAIRGPFALSRNERDKLQRNLVSLPDLKRNRQFFRFDGLGFHLFLSTSKLTAIEFTEHIPGRQNERQCQLWLHQSNDPILADLPSTALQADRLLQLLSRRFSADTYLDLTQANGDGLLIASTTIECVLVPACVLSRLRQRRCLMQQVDNSKPAVQSPEEPIAQTCDESAADK